MANYQETAESGTSWVRATSVHIHNPLGGTPSISFEEEQVLVVGDKTFRNGYGNMVNRLHKTFDPSGFINLRHPVTGQLIGQTVTHEQLYVLLHSLYMEMAEARDAALAASANPPAPAPEPEPIGPIPE